VCRQITALESKLATAVARQVSGEEDSRLALAALEAKLRAESEAALEALRARLAADQASEARDAKLKSASALAACTMHTYFSPRQEDAVKISGNRATLAAWKAAW